MGINSASAFSLGVGLGIASYQVSVGQSALAASILNEWQPRANTLIQAHWLDNGVGQLFNVNTTSNQGIDTSRAFIQENLASKKPDGTNAANLYQLGLLTGIAEGQSSGPHDKSNPFSFLNDDEPWPVGINFVRDSLVQAQALLSGPLSFFSRFLAINELEQAIANSVQSNAALNIHPECQQLNADIFEALGKAPIP